MAVTMNAATFMGKNFQDNQNSIMNTTDLTLKKMFDISAKLVGEQDEISNVDKIHWEKHSWRHLSLIGDETVINLQRAKVYVFSDSVLCLGDKISDLLSSMGQTPETFTGRILFMSMFNDISCEKKDNEEECVANAQVVSILAKKLGIGQWSFVGPGSEKKWYSYGRE